MIAIEINLNTPNQDPKVSKEYSLFSLQRQSRNFDSKTGSAIFGTDSNAVRTLVRQRSIRIMCYRSEIAPGLVSTCM